MSKIKLRFYVTVYDDSERVCCTACVGVGGGAVGGRHGGLVLRRSGLRGAPGRGRQALATCPATAMRMYRHSLLHSFTTIHSLTRIHSITVIHSLTVIHFLTRLHLLIKFYLL